MSKDPGHRKKKDWCHQDLDKVLLVEGDGDCHVVLALCKAYNIPETFGIYECGSDKQVLQRLNALILDPNPRQVIGVMLDADSPSLDSRWQGVREKLRNHDYVFPERPDPQGTILSSESLDTKLGFWLMPDNETSGMLEDFCLELAKPESLQFAKECVEEAQARDLTSFKAVHHSKAIICTYLAWHDKPGNPLGLSITKGALSAQTAIAQCFTDWLIQLFT